MVMVCGSHLSFTALLRRGANGWISTPAWNPRRPTRRMAFVVRSQPSNFDPRKLPDLSGLHVGPGEETRFISLLVGPC